MRFDHLLHWVPELDAGVDAYRALGFTVRAGGQLAGMGAHNAACVSGLAYIELLAIYDWEQARRGPLGRGLPRLQSIIEAGGGASNFAIEVTDLRGLITRLNEAGVAMTPPMPGGMSGQDGAGWLTAFPIRSPRWGPFFIDYGQPYDVRENRAREQGRFHDRWTLDHIVVETAKPMPGSRWLARLLGVTPSQVADDTWAVPLVGCQVRFTPGDAERITRVGLSGADDPEGAVAGLRYQRVG